MGFSCLPHFDGGLIQFRKKGLFNKGKPIEPSAWENSIPERDLPTYRLLMNLVADSQAQPVELGILIPAKTLFDMPGNQLSRLGVPPIAGLSLSISMHGRVDSSDSTLVLEWQDSNTRTINPDFKGPFLQVGGEWRRLSKRLYQLREAARDFNGSAGKEFAERLPAWTGIQTILETQLGHDIRADRYLGSLRIYQPGAITLEVTETASGPDFSPVMLPKGTPAELLETDDGPDDNDLDISSSDHKKEAPTLLPPILEEVFEKQFSLLKGPTPPAMVLEKGAYLLIDPPLQTALNVVGQARRMPIEARREFLRNPRTQLAQALGENGESLAQEIFVETEQYSERIQGLGLWEKPNLPWIARKSTQWLPEQFPFTIGSITKQATPEAIESLQNDYETAVRNGEDTVHFQGEVFSTDDVQKALEGLEDEPSTPVTTEDPEEESQQSIDELKGPKDDAVLLIQENLQENDYTAQFSPRHHKTSTAFPTSLINGTIPKNHQLDGFDWICRAWKEGWPGVLLADDMGVGKTFQALAFLAWIRANKAKASSPQKSIKGPILIVAPTALLANWKKEAEIHLQPDTLGSCCEVFGKGLKSLKRKPETGGFGADLLDMDQLRDADWVLTTYDTLALYHQSFARIAFSVGIFDEIQKIKAPDTINSHAAKTANVNFVIGMTGTPIENRIEDLWCIMDRIAPGYLKDLKSFSKLYGEENEAALKELKAKLDEPQGKAPPVMLRRMKEQISKDLPRKTIQPYEVVMPQEQADAYDTIIQEAREGKKNRKSMLEILHKMRGISLHPNGNDEPDLYDKKERDKWVLASARLAKTVRILEEIAKKGEKALIFLEDKALQQSLATALAEHFRLSSRPVIINGEMSGPKRQAHVDAFQDLPKGFAVMILSPKAAGIGLTITAANHVIHLSRWWNPAVEDQCNDRTYRIGQKNDVTIHVPMAVHPTYGQTTFDIRLHELLEKKRNLSQNMLAPPISAGDADHLFGQVMGDGN